MLLRRYVLSCLAAVLAVAAASGPGALLLASSSPTKGCNTCHHRCPNLSVFQSEFFGYYRTCWRTWPGGQPPCPVTLPPGAVLEEGTTTPGKEAEQLHAPKPEAAPKR